MEIQLWQVLRDILKFGIIFLVKFINHCINGDRIENVLWHTRDIPCDTNNITKDYPDDIAQGLIAIGLVFKNQSSYPNIFVCGLLPRDESFSINKLIINEVSNVFKSKCLVKSFHFINQNNGWTLNNRRLDLSLLYSYDYSFSREI